MTLQKKSRQSTATVHFPHFDGGEIIRKMETILQKRWGYDQVSYRASIQELTQIIGLTCSEWTQAKRGRYLLKDQYQYNALLNLYQQLISSGDSSC